MRAKSFPYTKSATVFSAVMLILNLVYLSLDPDDDQFARSSKIWQTYVNVFENSIGIVQGRLLGINESSGLIPFILQLHVVSEAQQGIAIAVIAQLAIIGLFWGLSFLLAAFVAVKVARAFPFKRADQE